MSDETFPPEAMRFFARLPRQAPGSDAATLAVLNRLTTAAPVPPAPAVVDVGCGAGGSALVLAEALGTPVRAFDLAPDMVAETKARAKARGLDDRVQAEVADMAALPVPPGSLDLLWSEGSAYNLGLGEALRRWRPLMKPGGLAVVSDGVWLTDERPPAAVALWESEYPAIPTAAEAIEQAKGAGWRILFTEILPPADWDAYYGNIRAALAAGGHGLPPGFVTALETEAATWDTCGGAYGYLILALQA